MNTVPQTGITASTAATTFNRAFAGAASTATTNPVQIAAYNVAVTAGTTTRFPYIASAERSEGVVVVGTLKIDTDVITPTTTGLAGTRVYYRNLNVPVAN
jgi:hypothetical protein